MERCGILLLQAGGQLHAFMNRLFCFVPEPGLTLRDYRDGEDVYVMIASCLRPGEGGVRVEDLVLVTDTGCQVLTQYPKALQIVG